MPGGSSHSEPEEVRRVGVGIGHVAEGVGLCELGVMSPAQVSSLLNDVFQIFHSCQI